MNLKIMFTISLCLILYKYVNKNKKIIKYQKNIKRNSGWNKSLKKDEKYK